MKILLVEDDAGTADFIAARLRERGDEVDCATDGRTGLTLAERNSYAVLVVDRMLPEMDGIALVRALRVAGTDTPVLFLTTKSGIDDRVEGLEAGGDDYLVKPFAFNELAARINALARRSPTVARDAPVTNIRVGDLELDLLARRVERAGQTVLLQPQEFKLLEYLARNAGTVVTRTMLLENVWGIHFDTRTNIVETHMSRLRAKVDRHFRDELIQTVRGAGYVLRAD